MGWQEWPLPEHLQEKRIRPQLIASNQFGDIYLVDDENYWLVAILGGGTDTRIAGGWGDTGELFLEPTDIVASPGLDVLLCDNATHRILRFDRKLNFIADLTLDNMTPIPIDYPYQIAKNRWEEIVISTSSSSGIGLLSLDQPFIIFMGDNAYGTDRFVEITDLAINDEGDIGLIDNGEDVFVVMSRQGNLKIKTSLEGLINPLVQWWKGRWVLLGRDGKVFVLSKEDKSIKKILDHSKISKEVIFNDFIIVNNTIYAIDDITGKILITELNIYE